MARRAFPVRSRSAKRKTVWIGTAIQSDVALASSVSLIVSAFSPVDLGALKPTVVRSRGLFSVWPTAFGADLDFSGAYGLGIVSDEAFVAGQGSIPRPFDDDDWPGWIVHGYFAGHLEFQSGTGIENTIQQHVIDSKAMRKVGPNETLVWMAESHEGAVQVNIQARVLLMLS